jgi:hypothetical protein
MNLGREHWEKFLGEITLEKVIELQETGSSIRDIIQKELQ